MNRRQFIKKTGLAGGATALGAVSAPAVAKKTLELKMVTSWPKNFPGLGVGAQRLADRITSLSDGRLRVKVYSAGELVPAFGVFDAVSSGAADIYHSAEYYHQGKHKAFNLFGGVPAGMMSLELQSWIYCGGGQELWDKLSAEFNIKPFLVGSSGAQTAGWFRKEVNSLDDLKGLKYRMPGLAGEMWRELGVNVVNLPGGEIFPALQAGTIDAAEFAGPWYDLSFGFYKITKNYYFPTLVEGGSCYSMGFNKGVWDKLEKRDQEMITAVCGQEHAYSYAESNYNNAKALEVLQQKHGVRVLQLNDEILDAMGKAAVKVLPIVAEGPLGQEIFDAFIKARDLQAPWSTMSEHAYIYARDRALRRS